MHFGELESLGHTFAWKLGLHPSILAHFSSITSNFQIEVPGVLLLVYNCYNMLSIWLIHLVKKLTLNVNKQLN
jgi:hypothetical protein